MLKRFIACARPIAPRLFHKSRPLSPVFISSSSATTVAKQFHTSPIAREVRIMGEEHATSFSEQQQHQEQQEEQIHEDAVSLDNPLSTTSVHPPKPNVFAVVQVGGHQYKVTVGEHIIVNKVPISIGTQIRLHKVLLVGGKSFTAIGRPVVTQALVEATVEEHCNARKQIVFKKKRRKGYRRWAGYRAPLSVLRIAKISFETPEADEACEKVVSIE